jgi:hypothetical protein
MSSLVLIFKFLVFVGATVWFLFGCASYDMRLDELDNMKKEKKALDAKQKASK